MRASFADRLNLLFEALRPPGRGPYSSAEVVAQLNGHGMALSKPYLSQLRSGSRHRPSGEIVAALAGFFRIQPAYFTDDERYEQLAGELIALTAARDERARPIVDAILDLSPAARKHVQAYLDQLPGRAP